MAAGAFHAADVASHENESASSGLPDAAAAAAFAAAAAALVVVVVA